MEIIIVAIAVGVVSFLVGLICGASPFDYPPYPENFLWQQKLRDLEWEQRKLDLYCAPHQTFKYRLEMENEYQRGFRNGQQSMEYKPKTPNREDIAKLLNSSLVTTQKLAEKLEVKLQVK